MGTKLKLNDPIWICEECGIHYVYIPKKKLVVCDCKGSKQAPQQIIDFYET